MTTPTPPATRPRNPEAERLHSMIGVSGSNRTIEQHETLDAALRRERRNVVAEIRERAKVVGPFNHDWLLRVLDEVAGLSDD